MLSALSQQEQELIRLRFGAQFTYSEISKIVNRSEGAVKKQIYRLLSRLENQMENRHD